MRTIESILKQRLFLPYAVRLQANASAEQAVLLNLYGDERAHDARVREIMRPRGADAVVPHLWIDADEAEIVVTDADSDLIPLLLEYGFERSAWRYAPKTYTTYLDEEKVLDTLAWAASVGVGLSCEAWVELEDAGRAEPARRLAWNVRDGAFGDEDAGAWCERLRDEAGVRSLRDEIRAAVRDSAKRAVHLVPRPDGGLLQRHDPSADGRTSEKGCGALVLRRDDIQLRAYLPSHDWLSWALQRVLLDAWAEEAFGEGAAWHWG